MTMQQSTRTPTRKKFILWSATLLASLTALKFLSGSKKKNSETVKMLTQDGKLVEIDRSLLTVSGKKISNEELQNWVKK